MPNLFAGDIKIDPELTKAVGGVAAGPQNSLNNVYSRIKGRFNQGQVASGRPKSDYNAERMTATQGLGNQGIESSLMGVLGDTTYNDALAEREYQQNRQLAERVGELSKPSVLQQVLGGLSSAGQAGGEFYGLYDSVGKSKKPKTTKYSNSGPDGIWEHGLIYNA